MAKLTLNKLKSTKAIWLPQVPEHWELVKVRHLFKESTKKGFPNETLLVASQEHGVVSKDTYGKRTVEATKDLHNLKLVEQGDFVISLRSFQGGIELAHKRGIISPAYTIMKETRHIEKRYYKNLFKSLPFISLMTLCVKGIREGQNIDYPTFKNEYLPFPPLEEQKEIASYLDKKNNEIAKFIRNKERLIELLESEAERIISNAINKGVNENAATKYIDDDWLDNIPIHWHYKPLKYFVRMNQFALTEKTRPDYELQYIDIGNVTFKGMVNEPERILFKNAPSRARRIVKSGDTIMSTVRTYLKAIAFIGNADVNLIASTGFAVLTPMKFINSKYLKYLLSSSYFINKVSFWAIGVNYPGINNDRLKAIKIPVPSTLEEQQEILDFIEFETLKIYSAISKAQQEIDSIKEYREALITDLVTGKLSVPQLQMC
jgi:type I restriction enzyme S subunit